MLQISPSLLDRDSYRSHPVPDALGPIPHGVELEMVRLHRGIVAGLDAKRPRIVQFTGASKHVGTTRMVLTLAEVMARRGSAIASVDLCGADNRDLGPLHLEALTPDTGHRQHGLVAQDGVNDAYVLGKGFDLLLIDTDPVASSGLSMEITSCVAGTVLVVEADRTHDRDIRKALDLIETCGGRCLGLLLNKRRRGWGRP